MGASDPRVPEPELEEESDQNTDWKDTGTHRLRSISSTAREAMPGSRDVTTQRLQLCIFPLLSYPSGRFGWYLAALVKKEEKERHGRRLKPLVAMLL